MRFTINEILAEAIMNSTPAVIVEGVDDIEVYDVIKNDVNSSFNVIAVENIDDYVEGCQGVKDAMDDVNSLVNTSAFNYRNYIVGIIDKDVCDFRNEVPNNDFIFHLKYYSIESYFCTNEIVGEILKLSTRTTENLISDDTKDVVFNSVAERLKVLYLLSLEALKGAVDSNYESLVKYSFPIGRFIKNNDVITGVNSKEEELLLFAQQLGLSNELSSMKRFVRGKWLIFLYCFELENALKNISGNCHEHGVETCQYCAVEAFDKCLYRLKDGFTHKTIRNSVYNFTDKIDFSDVKNRLQEMVA
ncbi:hypothetical protein [Photobacterium satsumensis]|uniref:hypothetical protein n=1 Tax=Photobacterium satsumensis TaxID=2910239 RepID=UPI003D0C4D95